ncbi:hypothetical protein H696_00776 [Fonticula alba]|uniref:Amidohydrolase-related domain-containing protein n=1 Tax=Fonticula alba TaxID=691883 RepID=A0A058ZFR7_FONAL|nr:hypothetical protein H696_00776 [Fonticula alba]KCV73235.1 hypothetical protein H696_00776 [Fonticula alba]|eukprot:XP_009492936.1 hypothetical protein H696_00776 [Fonticula alba]
MTVSSVNVPPSVQIHQETAAALTVGPCGRMQVKLIIKARFLLPIIPEDTLHQRFSVAINTEGTIVALGPSTDIAAAFIAEENVDLLKSVLLPGFVNGHAHAGMTNMRGYAEDLPLSEWLTTAVWPAEGRCVSHAFVRDGTQLAIAEMLRSGTTCFNEMYFFPEATCEVVDETGIRAVVGMTIMDFPTNYASNYDEYVSKGLEAHKLYNSHPRISFTVSPHAPYTVCDENLSKAWDLAKELDIPFNIHLHETADEVLHSSEPGHEGSSSRHRSSEYCSPVVNLDRLGIKGPRLIGAHMVHLSDSEIELLAKEKSNTIHCPESNLKLASGFSPVQKLLNAGVNVGLGTDSSCSNNDLSMLGEIRTASLLGKAVHGCAAAMPGMTALKMATINGARAVGLDHLIGSIEPGKQADLVAISVRDGTVENIPMFSLFTHLTYSVDRSQVSDVWVAGKRLMSDRELLTIDIEAVYTRAQYWKHQLISGTDQVLLESPSCLEETRRAIASLKLAKISTPECTD